MALPRKKANASGGKSALFRATRRKKPKEETPLLMEVAESVAPPEMRRAEDFYPTVDVDPIRSLLSARGDGQRIRALGSIWDCSCGDGVMTREMVAAGIPTQASDLVDRGYPGTGVRSFFDFTESPAPVIITNPPYDLINARDGHGRWLRHALTMPGWRYMAFLLSWDWPAARANGLGAMLDANPFSYAWLCRWKIDFTGQGSPPQRNAWFVWDRDDPRRAFRTGDAPGLAEVGFRWLDRVDDRQAEMFDTPPDAGIDPYRGEAPWPA